MEEGNDETCLPCRQGSRDPRTCVRRSNLGRLSVWGRVCAALWAFVCAKGAFVLLSARPSGAAPSLVFFQVWDRLASESEHSRDIGLSPWI